MKGKAYIPLVVGLVVGVLAIKLTFDYVRKARGATLTGDMVNVVRARTTIPMAAEVTADMVEVVSAPRAFVPKDAFNKKEDVVGRVTSVVVPKDMPVVANLLSAKGTVAGVEARIPEGYRAVAVKIDESSGVAFLVKPGSRVDVVAVMTTQGGRESETISKTILQNIEVAAVGQELGNNADKGAMTSKTITLLLKPEDVPSLHLAAQKGKILLAMRNQGDMSSRMTPGTTEKKLLGREDKPAGSNQAGLLTRLFGSDESDSKKVKPEAKHAAAVVAVSKVVQEWPVETISGSRKGKTELALARFDGPESVRRSGPAGLSSRGRTLAPSRMSEPSPQDQEPSVAGEGGDGAGDGAGVE